MKGVEILYDDKGNKRYVQLDVNTIVNEPEAVEELLDVIICEARKNEPSISLEELKVRSKKVKKKWATKFGSSVVPNARSFAFPFQYRTGYSSHWMVLKKNHDHRDARNWRTVTTFGVFGSEHTAWSIQFRKPYNLFVLSVPRTAAKSIGKFWTVQRSSPRHPLNYLVTNDVISNSMPSLGLNCVALNNDIRRNAEYDQLGEEKT